MLITAREHAVEQGSDNLEFVEGDVYALDYADATFDVVYANQLLQHLADPVAALQEMRRVLRPGGLLGVRDADYATMHPAPKFAEYERWDALYHAVAYVNNAEPDAGRYLSGWVRAAGFDEVELQPNVQLLEGDEARIWGEAWSQRILHSAVASQALEYRARNPGAARRAIGRLAALVAAAPPALHVHPNRRPRDQVADAVQLDAADDDCSDAVRACVAASTRCVAACLTNAERPSPERFASRSMAEHFVVFQVDGDSVAAVVSNLQVDGTVVDPVFAVVVKHQCRRFAVRRSLA